MEWWSTGVLEDRRNPGGVAGDKSQEPGIQEVSAKPVLDVRLTQGHLISRRRQI